ncbi:MAG: radical SAM protein [Cyclobacteriaceae bacterium]
MDQDYPAILLVTPPFTQLNTPYPATSYLKGFLDDEGINCRQADLSLETALSLFSKNGLKKVFDLAEQKSISSLILELRFEYEHTIDSVKQFLQGNQPTLAIQICERKFLPEGARFDSLDDLDWAFGNLGIQDKAKHLCTLYLDDLVDFIQQHLDSQYGMSRYAEDLSRSATSFDPIQDQLKEPASLIDQIMIQCLERHISEFRPEVVGFTVPFPGNLFGALRLAKHLKAKHSDIKTIMGGGYVNTELRKLTDVRIFELMDFITFDDGEQPLLSILKSIKSGTHDGLCRTKILKNNEVVYLNNEKISPIPFNKSATPSTSGLPTGQYLSVLEVANPMHRLWSDGQWNKLTMAHGCYWKKCTFCDISLDYIANYQPANVVHLCDQMETMIEETGITGFHFVDEAAPPALMRDLALEIINRNLKVTWWTNIRFESRFTKDLCSLLNASGCIAVSGGLEVAADRVLQLIDKGVDIEQVAQVTDNFTQAGIMVHAYLMYGFPTQTDQETIDAVEIVRQLFINGTLQSGFWHLFSMTAHSPVGINPASFDVVEEGPNFEGFAHNDLIHADPTGADHEQYSQGLKTSIYNYMHGVGFDLPVNQWFDFKAPVTTIPPNYIENLIRLRKNSLSAHSQVIWIGKSIKANSYDVKKKGKLNRMMKIEIKNGYESHAIKLNETEGQWLMSLINDLSENNSRSTFSAIEASYNGLTSSSKNLIEQPWFQSIREAGLLII